MIKGEFLYSTEPVDDKPVFLATLRLAPHSTQIQIQPSKRRMGSIYLRMNSRTGRKSAMGELGQGQPRRLYESLIVTYYVLIDVRYPLDRLDDPLRARFAMSRDFVLDHYVTRRPKAFGHRIRTGATNRNTNLGGLVPKAAILRSQIMTRDWQQSLVGRSDLFYSAETCIKLL